MLGRKTYTREELDHCRAAVAQQLAAYTTLVEAVASATADQNLETSLRAFKHCSSTTGPSSSTATSSTGSGWSRARTATHSTTSRYAIRLTADEFDRLSTAFFAELERTFL